MAPVLVSERPALDEELWFGKLDERAEDLAAASLAARVGRILGTKPFPAAARRLDELTRGSSCSIDEAVRVLESDPALSARLLRLVNSVGYALRVRCGSVRHATVLVGTRRLNQLATTAAVLDLFDQSTPIAARLVEHASTVGSLCRYLAVHLGLPRDELATCGFLHDIGKLMLLDSEGAEYRALLERYAKRADRMHEVERERFGFDHAVLGAHVLAAWNIPDPVPKVVAWHHQPARAVQNGGLVASMVQALRLANALAYELGQTPRAEAIEKLASSDTAMYLEISAPQLAAMWGDLEALHDAARSRGKHDAVPDILPRRPSVEPKSSSAPSLPRHFPCVVCEKASFGSTCTACGAYACPEHWLAREQWCTSCATSYRTEDHTPPWSVVAVSSGLMATASGTAALASGSGIGATLVVASLSAVCAATVSVVVSRARERVRFLRGRGFERELASQAPELDEEASLEHMELPPTPILPGFEHFDLKENARDRVTDPAPRSTDPRDGYQPNSVSIAPVIPVAPNMPTLSVMPDPFVPVGAIESEATVSNRTEPLPPPIEPFALASDFPTLAIVDASPELPRVSETPPAEAARATEAPGPDISRATEAPPEITYATEAPAPEVTRATEAPPEITYATEAPAPEVTRATEAPAQITCATEAPPPSELRLPTAAPSEIAPIEAAAVVEPAVESDLEAEPTIETRSEPVSATFVSEGTFDEDDGDSRPTLVNEPPSVPTPIEPTAERRDSHPAIVLLERKPRTELRYNARAPNGVRCAPAASWYRCASSPSITEAEQRPSVCAAPEWSEPAPRYATP